MVYTAVVTASVMWPPKSVNVSLAGKALAAMFQNVLRTATAGVFAMVNSTHLSARTVRRATWVTYPVVFPVSTGLRCPSIRVSVSVRQLSAGVVQIAIASAMTMASV